MNKRSIIALIGIGGALAYLLLKSQRTQTPGGGGTENCEQYKNNKPKYYRCLCNKYGYKITTDYNKCVNMKWFWDEGGIRYYCCENVLGPAVVEI